MSRPRSAIHAVNGGGRARLRLQLVPEPAAAVQVVVDELAQLLTQHLRAGRPCVLGLASGGTMLAVYAELVRRVREDGLDLSALRAFNLDEYVGLGAQDPRSFAAYMQQHLVQPAGLDPACVVVPDGLLGRQDPVAAAEAYERAIAAAGGVQLQLLGLGRNGHIGFNEPGSAPDSRTRLVELAAATRADAAGDFGGLEAVPRTAITMGVATILDARRLRVLAFGEHKAAAVAAAMAGEPTPDWPCSYLTAHPDARLYVDDAAASRIAQ